MKNVINFNNKGQRHGYQEQYWSNGQLSYKCFFYNNIPVGYGELYYYYNGKLARKTFNI